MVYYKKLVFNPLQVNCWLVYNDSGNCLVIDPSCSDKTEMEQFVSTIEENGLKPRAVIATHGHFDHVPGVGFIRSKYDVPFLAHKDDEMLISIAKQQAEPFGFEFGLSPELDDYIEEGSFNKFAEIDLQVLHVPGHSPGSVAYYSIEGGFVIVGDVLFKGSIGRTDLPGGDYDTLMDSIKNKLSGLPAETIVLPGHGMETTLAAEAASNPFLI